MRAIIHELDVMRKFVGQHSAKCAQWDQYLPDGYKEYYAPTPPTLLRLDAIGRASPRARWEWMVYRCNTPECEATMLVRLADLGQGEAIE